MTALLVPVKNGFTLISDEDRHLLEHRWRVVKPSPRSGPYVTATIDGKTVYLHRLIIGAQKGQEVDHINRDGLDNRRENLRIVTRSQNCLNTRTGAKSGFRGVYQHPNDSTWQVKLTIDRTRISGGSYPTREEAARAYDRLARKHHGLFAVLNFPEEETV